MIYYQEKIKDSNDKNIDHRFSLPVTTAPTTIFNSNINYPGKDMMILLILFVFILVFFIRI